MILRNKIEIFLSKNKNINKLRQKKIEIKKIKNINISNTKLVKLGIYYHEG